MKLKKKFLIILISYIIINILFNNLSFALTSLQEKAADLNGDGIVDKKDIELMVEIGVPENTIKSGIKNPNGSSGEAGVSVNGILEAAKKLHDAQTSWGYSTNISELVSGNIEGAISNKKQKTCCATYVSSVLYTAGCFTANEMNSFEYNGSTDLNDFLDKHGWQKIISYEMLQPGDIVFMTNTALTGAITHVQIYAGDDMWYNAGARSYIQGQAPYKDNSSKTKKRFLLARRSNSITSGSNDEYIFKGNLIDFGGNTYNGENNGGNNTVGSDGQFTEGNGSIIGYYTRTVHGKSRTFTIYNQVAIGYPNGCNRVVAAAIASGYEKDVGLQAVKQIANASAYLGCCNVGTEAWFKKFGLSAKPKRVKVGSSGTGTKWNSSIEKEIVETLKNEGFVMFDIGDAKYVGKSGAHWTQNRHWLGLLDIRWTNGNCEVFVAMVNNHAKSGWYSIDEWSTAHIANMAIINEI